MQNTSALVGDRTGGRRTAGWVFDLDNTLYCPSARLFDQINARMTAFIARRLSVDPARADDLRQRYWRRYGTTLAGLVAEHRIAADDFLDECHEIDLSALTPDAELAHAIACLPGARVVHTNGPRAHARRVLAARGLDGLFDRVIAIEDTYLVPKPERGAYDAALALAAIDPTEAIMIEDHAENLVEPKRRGMTTVWLHHGRPRPGDHVDHAIDDLTEFLRAG